MIPRGGIEVFFWGLSETLRFHPGAFSVVGHSIRCLGTARILISCSGKFCITLVLVNEEKEKNTVVKNIWNKEVGVFYLYPDRPVVSFCFPVGVLRKRDSVSIQNWNVSNAKK
mmetsp:Transcript_36701/g.42662  ORF Transcript_36701/g.42662 Transcript_36701/m.42662 type:complete len:113 (+) Transcript_36701:353-691(+)